MARRLNLRRCAAIAASTLLLGTVGCAFPHGNTAGDPLLGSFNRPIVPTPPPERGGLGLDSPAYDGGARIGMTSPEVPTQLENSPGFNSLPNLTSPSLFSGARMPFGAPDDSKYARRQSGRSGAQLPGPTDSSVRLPGVPTYGRPVADAAMARPRDQFTSLSSAASIMPVDPLTPIKQVSYESRRDTAKVESMEDAQSHLLDLGARGMRTEQMSNGEWLHTCTVGQKVYEARGNDQLEAMRKVLEQVRSSR